MEKLFNVVEKGIGDPLAVNGCKKILLTVNDSPTPLVISKFTEGSKKAKSSEGLFVYKFNRALSMGI